MHCKTQPRAKKPAPHMARTDVQHCFLKLAEKEKKAPPIMAQHLSFGAIPRGKGSADFLFPTVSPQI